MQYGLLGRTLAHSFSRGYFADKFAREGLAGHRYDNFELADIAELPGLLASRPGLVGFNVTIPYKRAVIPYLDVLDPVARRVGAVNAVVREPDGSWRGSNTDVAGFALTLDGLDLGDVTAARGAPALILGTGGASDAVREVLRQRSMPHVLVSRSPGGGQLGYDALPGLDWAPPRLLVNTTPVGTWPDTEAAPEVPLARLGSRHVVVDLIYNPPETALLRAAREAGAQTASGLTMLHGQAEAAWALWSRSAPGMPRPTDESVPR